MNEIVGASPGKDLGSLDEQWKKIKDTLLKSTDQVSGWTKGPPRHRVTWWWNASVENCVKGKRKLWSQWKKGSVNKERDLEAKRAARRAIYKAKMDAEKRRFPDIMRRDDQKNKVFKMAKKMIKTNQDIMGEKCIRNDDGELATSEIQKTNA